MQADLPFFDCPEDALKAAVQHLGGAKSVGAKLWPDKSADQAARQLLDALNPGRAEKLEISQVMRILAWARDAGYHAAMLWISAEIGYEARAVRRAEEVDRLTSMVEHSTKTLSAALAALERIGRSA